MFELVICQVINADRKMGKKVGREKKFQIHKQRSESMLVDERRTKKLEAEMLIEGHRDGGMLREGRDLPAQYIC
jgi:hypothetical protein